MASRSDMIVQINTPWCKGCGVCVEFCPKKVLEIGDDAKVYKARPDDCIKCGMCEMRCPDLAIFLAPINNEGEGGANG